MGLMKNAFLIGPTIYLRPLEVDDAPTFLPWINDPEVTRTLKIYRPMNRHAEEMFLRDLYRDECQLTLGIASRAGDALLGSVSLAQVDLKNRHASLGIFIGDTSAWGRGHGREAMSLMLDHAFETLNLNRVWLHVYEYNERAIRLYTRLGFKTEGVLRHDRYHGGRYWDTLTLGLLREEWEARKGGER